MKVFYPLSANPFHDGHKYIHDKMVEKYGNCTYVLSTDNADKGSISREEIYKRAGQLNGDILLLKKNTFMDMLEYIQRVLRIDKVVFALGVDTFERVVQPKYYRLAVVDVLKYFLDKGVVFEVFSRNSLTLNDLYAKMSPELRAVAEKISVCSGYSLNISSTELRNAKDCKSF